MRRTEERPDIHIQPAGDFGFTDPGAVQLSDLAGMEAGGDGSSRRFPFSRASAKPARTPLRSTWYSK
jgi:hypothetical protein